MLTATHHVAIICSDLEKSLDFYAEKLGFTVFRKVWRESHQDHLLMLRSGDVVLELFTKSEAPARLTEPEALGLRHLAFKVEDVEAAAAWLNEKGIETEPIRQDPFDGGRLTFFRDPDGLPLEIHE